MLDRNTTGGGGDGGNGARDDEALLGRMLDATPDAVFQLDGGGRVQVANRAGRALALAGADPVGLPAAKGLGEGFGRALESLARQAASQGEAAGRVVHPGRDQPFNARAFACGDGACLFLCLAEPDALPGADDCRQVPEAQLAALFDNAPVGFAYFDRDHRVTRINTWMARAIRRPVEEIVGRRPEEFLVVTAEQITGGLTELFATGKAPPVQEISAEHPAEPGRRRDFLVGWFPVVVGGALVNAGAVVTEITALRAAEAQGHHLAEVLERERRLLQAVVDQMPAGVVAVEVPSGKPVLVNAEAERLLGHPIMPLKDMEAYASLGGLHPDGRPYGPEDYPVVKAFRSGAPTSPQEVIYRRGDGTLTTLSVRAAPVVDADRRIRLSVASFHDISQRKIMENALREAKEEAEHANLAKSRFLAAASHDLRQPLQSLFFFSETLATHVSDEVGRRRLQLVQQALGALKGLLDSLLDVSRLDANMVEPHVDDVSLTALLHEIRDAYEPLAAARGLAVRLEASPLWGRSDPTLLGRILRNLVDNALRYTQQGEIVMTCRPERGGAARISIRDTGIGIPAEHMDRIWEEFHQVGNPARDREHGLGLGLAIVRRLAGLLDHRLHVRSEAGRGSEFSVIVPLGRRPAAPGPAEPVPEGQAGAPPQGALVLVIDDDAIVLMGTRTQLEDWGYETIGAASAAEAALALRTDGRCPDLVLADYRLQRGEVGTEAVERVRALCGPIPALMLTGETDPDTQRSITAAGLGLLHKPATPSQLRRSLQEHMRPPQADAPPGRSRQD